MAGDLADALDAVGGNSSPVPTLAAAVRRLERRAAEAQDLVRPAVEAIDLALDALETARAHLEAALAEADFDPRELERIEERVFALRAAARKYGGAIDDLPVLAARFSAQLDSLDRGATRRLDRGFGEFEAWREEQLELEEQAAHKLGRQIVREEHWLRHGVSGRRKRNMRRVGELQALRQARRE
eukprot:gene20358-24957_t